MKQIIGIVMLVLGIVLGLYVGGWVFFVGGIAGLIDVVVGAVNGTAISGWEVAVNIGKIVFAGLAGYLSAIVLVLPSIVLIQSK